MTHKPAPELAIDYVPLDQLRRWPRNPKHHDVGAIAEAIRTLGFRDPIGANRRTREIEEGHGRLDALQAMKARGTTPPPFVRVGRGGDWLVPVLWFDDDRQTQERWALAHNRTHELGGGYDQPGLAQVLADAAAADALAGTGYDRDDVDQILAGLVTAEPRLGAEREPLPRERTATLQAEWGTARGQLWRVGRHRVLCGDATYADDVRRLLGETRLDAVVTDPPYCSGGFQEADRRRGSVGTDREGVRVIAGDTLSTRGYVALLKNALTLADAGVVYIFTDWRMWVHLFDLVEGCGYGVRNMIVWDKGTPGMGQGWRAQHELILFASKIDHHFNPHLAQGNVVRADRTGNVHHTVEKPLALLRALLGVTEWARAIGDPFLGSGSTILAAEAAGRTCYGLELDPGWLAVCLARCVEAGLGPIERDADGSGGSEK